MPHVFASVARSSVVNNRDESFLLRILDLMRSIPMSLFPYLSFFLSLFSLALFLSFSLPPSAAPHRRYDKKENSRFACYLGTYAKYEFGCRGVTLLFLLSALFCSVVPFGSRERPVTIQTKGTNKTNARTWRTTEWMVETEFSFPTYRQTEGLFQRKSICVWAYRVSTVCVCRQLASRPHHAFDESRRQLILAWHLRDEDSKRFRWKADKARSYLILLNEIASSADNRVSRKRKPTII